MPVTGFEAPDVVVVTGAASGIGRGIATHLVAAGSVAVAVDTDAAGLARLEAELGPNVVTIADDVSDPAAHATALDATEELLADQARSTVGWVNNAAVALSASLAELRAEQLDAVLGTNLRGVVLGTAAAVRLGKRHGGVSVVNMSSTQAARSFAGYPAYAAAKGGVEALTRQVAGEYAGSGVRVNAVAPGVIWTEMNEAILAASDDPADLQASWLRLCPVGRLGTTDDVAALVLFLLSSAAAFLTGQVITIDGGQSVLPPSGSP